MDKYMDEILRRFDKPGISERHKYMNFKRAIRNEAWNARIHDTILQLSAPRADKAKGANFVRMKFLSGGYDYSFEKGSSWDKLKNSINNIISILK